MARMICGFLLHLNLLPEVRSAKDMMSFTKKNITHFSDQRFEYAMMFAVFKMAGGFFCIICNLFIVFYSDSVFNVVSLFVSVAIISQVDNMMLGTVTECAGLEHMKVYISKERMARTDIEIWNENIREISETKATENAFKYGEYVRPLHPLQKIMLIMMLVLYRIISIVYNVAYFYFAPYMIPVVLFSSGLIGGANSAAVSNLPV